MIEQQAALLTDFDSNAEKKEDIYSKHDITNSLTTICSNDIDDVQYMPSHDSFSRAMNSSYWDGDSTQSQQFDKLLDDIWERSQEYQDYFAAQEEKKEEELLSKRVSKQAYAFIDYKH